MNFDENMINEIVSKVVQGYENSRVGVKETSSVSSTSFDGDIPVGVSNRHIHLTQADLETLFGPGYQLTHFKDLSQPGQFACKEQLTLVGPSLKAIEGVRILGPLRKASQVEISGTDARTLKINAPVRESGDVQGSAPITIIGPKGVLTLKEGCILANRHIHMSPADAEKFNVKDGDYVAVDTVGNGKRTTLWDCQVRVNEKFVLEMHLDTDDANACGIGNGAKVKLIKNK